MHIAESLSILPHVTVVTSLSLFNKIQMKHLILDNNTVATIIADKKVCKNYSD